MDTDNTQQLQLTQAQAELVKLQQTIATDAGPIVFCIAIDRYGHANIAQGPLMVGREVGDLETLLAGLHQVIRRVEDALIDAKVEARTKVLLPSSNGHHEPVG